MLEGVKCLGRRLEAEEASSWSRESEVARPPHGMAWRVRCCCCTLCCALYAAAALSALPQIEARHRDDGSEGRMDDIGGPKQGFMAEKVKGISGKRQIPLVLGPCRP